MKIIVVGCGKIGEKIAERLSMEQEHDITVIDLNAKVIEDIVAEYDVMGVVGSGASLDTLIEAGIKETDILIAVTGSDEVNLLTCLIAKKGGSNCQTIARIRKPEYNKEISLFKEDLGLAMIINPELAAANEIARSMSLPDAINIDTFAKGRIEILNFKVTEESVLNGVMVSDITRKMDCDILVCGVQRGGGMTIPRGDFLIESGDLISVIASLKNGAFFLKKIGLNKKVVKDTIIVGGGNIAYYLAKRLIESGIDVKIIERNPARCDELCELLPKANVVLGDGTDNRVLLEEGIERATSFVALTNIDEENILLSLFAKSKMKGKLVTKINRIAYDEVINNLNLDTTIYPKNIAAEYIVRFVRAKKNSIGSNIETMHFIIDNKAEALEFRIRDNSPISNLPIEKLNLKKNVIIACINRNGRAILPRGKDMILSGDTIIVVTTHSGYKGVEDLLDGSKSI